MSNEMSAGLRAGDYGCMEGQSRCSRNYKPPDTWRRKNPNIGARSKECMEVQKGYEFLKSFSVLLFRDYNFL